MILTLFVWAYITFICFNWGHLFFRLIPGNEAFHRQPGIQWPVVCLTGLAITGVLTCWLSIFMPIGLTAHLILLVPAVVYYLYRMKVKRLLPSFAFLRQYSRVFYVLLASAVVMVLFLCTYTIIHPDTTMYHASAIKWIETYKAIPGIVNFNTRLGYQSWWFSTLAVFRFSFLAPNNFLFANGCLLCWFLVFVTGRIDWWYRQYKEQVASAGPFLLMWTVLLLISLLSWTQVRLTAASASPDFIAALYAWAAFYFFFTRASNNRFFTVLVVALSCAAIAAKFSVALLILLPAFLFWRLMVQKQFAAFLLLLFGSLLIIAPGIIRNVINSGYPLYPSPAFNVFNPDWKTTPAAVQREANYIKAYARAPFPEVGDTEKMIQVPLDQWFPVWWHQLLLADQLLLLLLVVLFFFNLFSLVKQVKNRDATSRVVLLVSLAGCVGWFAMAPAPRFGIGFLIPLLFSLYAGVDPPVRFARVLGPSSCRVIAILIAVAITSYTVYRSIYFFQPRQLVMPMGIEQPNYQEALYEGVNIYINHSPAGCGFSPVPCVSNPSPGFILRGPDISDGFRHAPNQ